MNYLGEFGKNSKILLVLLTKDENNQPVNMDFSPTATFGVYETNGITTLDNVTLNISEDGSQYEYLYTIPTDWKDGYYKITYSGYINGEVYQTEETFTLHSSNSLDTSNEGIKEYDEQAEEASTVSYIPPPEFQIDATLEVDGNTVILQPNGSLKLNYMYTVVVDKSIKALNSSNTLQENKIIQFTTEYSPLYATPLEVRFVLKELYPHFKMHDIYTALKDAGQKAHQLTGQIPDPNNSRFRMIQERDDIYFPTTKFVLYEASRQLLSSLLVSLLNSDEESGSISLQSDTGGFTLGDLTISDNNNAANFSKQSLPELTVIENIQTEIDRELKFWMDAMMGRNKRGYAAPVTATQRGGTAGPESRDF